MSLVSSPNGAKLGPKVTTPIGVDGSKVTKKASPRLAVLKGWPIVVTNYVPTGPEKATKMAIGSILVTFFTSTVFFNQNTPEDLGIFHKEMP